MANPPIMTEPAVVTSDPDADAPGTVVRVAGSLPPFAGGATAANQVLEIAELAAISAQLPEALVGGRLDTVVGAPLPAGANAIGTVTAVGAAAQGAAVSGNPLLGALEGRTTLPTKVADGQAVRAQGDVSGRTVTCPHSPRGLNIDNTITLTDTTETTLLAQAASTFHDMVLLVLSNTSDTKVRADIRDATGGTVRLSVSLAASGGGAVIQWPVPKEQTAVNNNWTVQLSGSVTDVRVYGMAVKRN